MLPILKSIRLKIFFIALFFFSFIGEIVAQLNEIIKSDIDKGSTIVAPYFKNRIDDSVRLVGLGQIQHILKESSRLNSAISGYLIKKKGFNIVAIDIADWELRHFNKYLVDETNVFSENEFGLLFKKTFEASAFLNEDFKAFMLWLKKYNQSQKNNKVSVKGYESILREPLEKFHAMNDYFIETYIRPYNDTVADTMKVVWKRAGNSSSYLDTIVLKKMLWWKDFVVSKKLMSDSLIRQMSSDIAQRQALYDWAKTSHSNHLNRSQSLSFSDAISLASKATEIYNLMKVQSNRIIYLSSNGSVLNAEIYGSYLTSNESKPVRPGVGLIFKGQYKDKYFIVVSTFADSAAVLGYKNHQPYQPIVVAGDNYTKTMLSKKEVYAFPDDEAALSKLVVPIINSGFFKEDLSLRVKYTKGTPFNMIFIFKNLTLSKFLTEDGKKN